ncbi:MAG: hypothetical protein ABR498_06630 [Candidatus Dormibacteria bacterium]
MFTVLVDPLSDICSDAFGQDTWPPTAGLLVESHVPFALLIHGPVPWAPPGPKLVAHESTEPRAGRVLTLPSPSGIAVGSVESVHVLSVTATGADVGAEAAAVAGDDESVARDAAVDVPPQAATAQVSNEMAVAAVVLRR